MSVEGLKDLEFHFGNLFKKVVPDSQRILVRRIAMDAFIGMVEKSPVDTGRARANWSVTIGKPRAAATDAIDKAPFGSPPTDTVAPAVTANSAKLEDTIYVTNDLPYIAALEDGYSKQGAHMVELTVNEIKAHYGI